MRLPNFVFFPPTFKMRAKYGKFYRELEPKWKKIMSELEIDMSYGAHSRCEPSGGVHFMELCRAYSGKDRFYHNPQHLLDCLKEFEEVRASASSPLTVSLGLWFHDAVYDTRANDNELKSSKYMKRVLSDLGVSCEILDSTKKIILVTDHKTPVENKDEALAVDSDLSIFGKPEGVFEDYDKNIRLEYSWVPEEAYRTRRKQVLRSFLDRPWIYYTRPFREKYEEKARDNLERAIKDLE